MPEVQGDTQLKMIHICERCSIEFEYFGNVKRCPECRITCAKCGSRVTGGNNLCDSCRPTHYRYVKCAAPACEKKIRYSKGRTGFCREHVDWEEHGRRMAEYNIRVKTKPDELKYKTENIPAISRVCIVCGSEYLATPAAIKKGGGVVCSRKCQGVRAAQLTPKKDTSIERAIEHEFKMRGWKYQKQVPLCGVTLADFYLPSFNAVVFCDGTYWHSLPGRKIKDKNQDEILIHAGYTVHRFSENSIKKSPSECVSKIL